MKSTLLISALLLSASLNVFADNAKTLTVKEEVAINASAAKVWEKVSNFNDLGAWHPAVKTTEIVAGENNKVGAERLLTLQDGGTIKEKLLAYNAKAKTFKYSIMEGVLPVSDYVSTVTVKATGKNTSKVIWKGNFKRKDVSATPAEGQDDATAVKVVTSVYQGGLENLKKISE
jgi:mxaD protein